MECIKFRANNILSIAIIKLNDYVSIKNIHLYVISLYPHQSHFNNKSKCGIAVMCLYFSKKERYDQI